MALPRLDELRRQLPEEGGCHLSHQTADPSECSLSASLHDAIVEGDAEKVKGLLLAGASVTIETAELGFPLSTAVKHGHVELTRLLLGVSDVNQRTSSQGRTALHEAVIHGGGEMVTLLLSAGADATVADRKSRNALHHAIQSDCSVDIVWLMLEQGCTPQSGLDACLERGRDWVLVQLLEAGLELQTCGFDGNTLLHMVAQHKKPELVRVLLDRGLEVSTRNAMRESSLHIAAACADLESIKLMLHHISDDSKIVNLQNTVGVTALFNSLQKACQESDSDAFEIIGLLLAAGASCTLHCPGISLAPLLYTFQHQKDAASVKAMKQLIRSAADVMDYQPYQDIHRWLGSLQSDVGSDRHELLLHKLKLLYQASLLTSGQYYTLQGELSLKCDASEGGGVGASEGHDGGVGASEGGGVVGACPLELQCLCIAVVRHHMSDRSAAGGSYQSLHLPHRITEMIAFL